MNLTDALEIVRLTDVGHCRDHNEDAIGSDASIGLLILADGMGGYKAGEVASEMAVLTIVAELKYAILAQSAVAGFKDLNQDTESEATLLIDAVKKANEVIYQVSQTQPQCAGMGTTLVVSLFTDNKIIVAHIGDSRLYRLRQGELSQLTEVGTSLTDGVGDALVAEMLAELVTAGRIIIVFSKSCDLPPNAVLFANFSLR